MKRRILSTITALTMVMSVGCSSASALTPNLSTKTNQWQTATPVSSEYDPVGEKLMFTESQMETKFANDFKTFEIKSVYSSILCDGSCFLCKFTFSGTPNIRHYMEGDY